MLDYASFSATNPSDLHGKASWRYLEPSAGQGAIVDVLKADYPFIRVDCCEIDEHNRSVLDAKGYNLVGNDFLSADLTPGYDWIVMNPPFNGANGGYIEHINRAFD
jgi:Predicted RNA methylase